MPSFGEKDTGVARRVCRARGKKNAQWGKWSSDAIIITVNDVSSFAEAQVPLQVLARSIDTRLHVT